MCSGRRCLHDIPPPYQPFLIILTRKQKSTIFLLKSASKVGLDGVSEMILSSSGGDTLGTEVNGTGFESAVFRDSGMASLRRTHDTHGPERL
jgi:hypothetical protein